MTVKIVCMWEHIDCSFYYIVHTILELFNTFQYSVGEKYSIVIGQIVAYIIFFSAKIIPNAVFGTFLLNTHKK